MQNLRNEDLLNEVLSKCKMIVDKNYFNNIHELTFCSSPSKEGCIRLLKIEILTAPISPEFFTFVLNALGNLQEVFGYILKSFEDTLILYVGLKTAKSMCTAIDILKNGLKNSYPNSKFRELSPKESSLILEDLFDPNVYHALSSAIVIPNNTSASNAPINQKLVDLMGSEDFVAFFLASALTYSQIQCFIYELKELYTKLSSFSESDYGFSHSLAKNTAVHITKSTAENSSATCSENNGSENAKSASKYTLITPAAIIPLENLRTFSISIALNETCGIANVALQSVGKSETKGCTVTNTKLHINSSTHTNSDSLSYTTQNKFVIELLEKIDALILRLTLASGDPFFCFGAYFLSPSSATSIRAASTYLGLAKDNTLNIEDTFINTWEDCDSIFPNLLDSLRHFNQLSFEVGSKNECITTTTIINASELVNTFYFPYSKASDKANSFN
ncbi:hypothetical protein [Cellulosilyticum sp. I15G10I2]|uniref:hypothetical protein n=1 Tax=Cellulosilyticum sp. I15G10I2 TaxID=1892843 RepID=UPI00085C8C50|nr:hypothetical protein [Cellulosilyticum sp. I15G10I2]